MKLGILCFCILSFLVSTAFATNYFIATTGSDSNPGTLDKPFRNIQKAAEKTEPSDTVFVREGVYDEYIHSGTTINITKSGEPDAYIVFMAYPGENPKINSPTWNAFDLPRRAVIKNILKSS